MLIPVAILTGWVYLLLFILTGLALPEKIHRDSICRALPLGFAAYYGVFQLIALPMKATRLPLHILRWTWMGVLLLLLIWDIRKRRNNLIRCAGKALSAVKNRRYLLIIPALWLAMSLAFGLNTDHISLYDEGYYMGLSASSAWSDTIEGIHPQSGKELQNITKQFYFMNTYTNHSAIVLQTLPLTARTESTLALAPALMAVFLTALYVCCKILLGGQHDAAIAACMMAILVLLFSFSVSGVSHYFVYRTYEGKSVASYLYTLLIYTGFLWLEQQEDRAGYVLMFLAGLGSVAFCNTSIFLTPMMCGIFLLTSLLHEPSLKKVMRSALTLIPGAVWCLIYLL